MVVLVSVIAILGACTGTPEPDGVALIDELIACDGPGVWDRALMLERLQADGDKYLEHVEVALEICTLAKSAPPTPTPGSPVFSDQALELRAVFEEMVKFKSEPWFHIFCFAKETSPASGWAEHVQGMESSFELLDETGIHPSHLWSMGVDYCQSEGRETDYTTVIFRDHMKPSWINYRPVLTPKPEYRVTPSRPYRSASEMLGECAWNNPAVSDLLQEAIEISDSAAELAVVIEMALDEATSRTTWDGAIAALTICQSSRP